MPKIVTTFQRTSCRLCNDVKLELAVPIPPTPVADKYLPPDQLDGDYEKVSLDLYRCQTCGHAQLLTVVDPAILWSDFTFQTGRTKGLIDHYGRMAEQIVQKYLQDVEGYVLDVGSNDGTLLKQFQSWGFDVLGVDPAQKIAEQAITSGVPTLVDYMTPELARRILTERGPAQAITATNVFAHTDDLRGMLEAIHILLDREGVFIFEASYLPDILDNNLVGTIFHEHLSYHAVGPLTGFFQTQGMELVAVERNAIQGGSIVGVVCQQGNSKVSVDVSVDVLVEEEQKQGVNNGVAFKSFTEGITNAHDKIHATLGEKGSLVGFGSARSATTFLAVYNLGDRIDFIVDDNPDKQNKLTTGNHIKVLPVEELYKKMPTMTVILAWVHTKKILASHRKYIDAGGTFLTLHPEVKLVNKENYGEVCRMWG